MSKIFFATSNPPHITKRDTGMWRRVVREPNEHCWETGEYKEGCDCEVCMHKDECSGYEGDRDDE